MRCNRLRLALFLLSMFLCLPAAHAEFIFTVSQRTPGDILQGSSTIFDVAIQTGPAMGTIPNFGGTTFWIAADDPLTEGGKTTGGTLGDGTNDSADPIAGGNTYLFTPGEGGFFNSGDSFLVFSATGSDRSLGTSGGLLGSFVLDTSGATVGAHTFTFSQLDAIEPDGDPLAGPYVGAPFNYVVVSVPEPTTALLTVCSFGAIAVRGLRRRSAARKAIHN